MICRACGTEIADKAMICYRCGEPTVEPKFKPVVPRRSSLLLLALSVVVFVLSVAGAVAVQFVSASETARLAVWVAPLAAAGRLVIVLRSRQR